MKFKIGDTVRISYGIIGVVTQSILGKKTNKYKVQVSNYVIIVNEEDLEKITK